MTQNLTRLLLVPAMLFSSEAFADDDEISGEEKVVIETNEKHEKGLELVGVLFEGLNVSGSYWPEDFRNHTIEHLFGDVWQGEELTLQQRSLITCVTIVALGRENEMRLHFVGARNVGIKRKTLEAAIAHVAHYAGWPTAASAYAVLRDVWPVEEAE